MSSIGERILLASSKGAVNMPGEEVPELSCIGWVGVMDGGAGRLAMGVGVGQKL